MVPFIDVMLVLLIIFMVTAPLITTGVVDLPTVGKGASAGAARDRDRGDERRQHAHARRRQGRPRRSASPTLQARVVEAQAGAASTPVVISADKNVKYESVVKVMDKLQRAGVQRVGLSVKNSPAR